MSEQYIAAANNTANTLKVSAGATATSLGTVWTWFGENSQAITGACTVAALILTIVVFIQGQRDRRKKQDKSE